MKSATKYAISSLAIFLIMFAYITAIPHLILSGKIRLFEGLLITLPVALSMLFIGFYFSMSGNSRKIVKPKHFILLFLSSYIFLASVLYILSTRNAQDRLLTIFPVDLLIFALPAYLIYRTGKPSVLKPEDYSSEYTQRLANLVGEHEANAHSVYFSDQKILHSFVDVSGGKEWHILLKRDSLSHLNPEELDAAILEAYFVKQTNFSRNLLISIATYISIMVDLLLISEVMVSSMPSGLALTGVIVAVVALATLFLTPFFISFLLAHFYSHVDREVLKYLSSSEPFASELRKKNTIRISLRPMTLKQQMRYDTRLNKMIEKRIKRLTSFDAGRWRN